MSYTLTDTLLIALAAVLVIEGFGPMLFTKKWQQYLLQMSLQPSNQLKTTGRVLVTIGLVSLLYLI
ncbi:DUF2065 domain-containing protein [Paraglaciecola sp.]|uniref:DUF2065 domain-containing protein n=1 Tax=Paraglaciecola sp. TaxID=1920173 RepID=UPI0032675D82